MNRLHLVFLLAGTIQAAFTDTYPASIASGSTVGFKIMGTAGNYLGDKATSAGDFNGDGLSDIVIASIPLGKLYVVFGKLGTAPFTNFNINTLTPGDTTGFSINAIDDVWIWRGAASIGDVNGDGIEDLSFGGTVIDYAGRVDVGAVFILYGRRTGNSDINVAAWSSSTSNGFRFYGENAGDNFGNQVLNLGDFNGDGIKDMTVFAMYGDLPNSGNNDYGVIYVIFGKGAAHGTDIDMLTGFTYGTQGFRVYPYDAINAVPVYCGDVNNDGYNDIAITASTETYITGRTNNGGVYILFGHSTATTFADVYLSNFAASIAGFLIIGATAGDNLGMPTSASRVHDGGASDAGDFNGDGLNDLVIGAQGKAYILFGRTGVTTYSTIDLASWPDSVNKGQRFVAQNPSTFGRISYVGSIGDFNGDGVGDVFLFSVDQNSITGWGAVMFGHKNNTPYSDITLDTFPTGSATGFRLLSAEANSYFGEKVDNAGDVNGDGAPDLLIAATSVDGGAGVVYVLYGTPPPPTFAPSARPTAPPTALPTVNPTALPTSQPSTQPSRQPSTQPSRLPTSQPTGQPSSHPSYLPSGQPFSQPSVNPATLRTIQASPTYKVRNGFAFAAVGAGGKVSAWGEAQYGGDASAVQSQLQSGVTEVVASRFAYAAVKADGSLALWGVNTTITGLARYGSLSYAVTGLVANGAAFAGVDTTTGRVIAAGSKFNGGNVLDDAHCNGYSALLSSGVRSITASTGAFAAIKTDGTLLCWGNKYAGADITAGALTALAGAKLVVATTASFAVLLLDRTVATWGNRWSGGDSSGAAGQLTEVMHLTASRSCFVAFKKDSGVVVWGYHKHGGDSSAVAASLSSHVTQVSFSYSAMAALKADGTVVAWGDKEAGGDASAVQASLHDITSIAANLKAFAALTSAGSVVAWGLAGLGGSISPDKVTALSSDVVSIAHTDRAFAALKSDGSVVVWGQAGHGGEPGAAVKALLTSGVHTICANDAAFSAIKTNGSVVAWGHSVSVPVAGVQFISSSLAAGAQCA